MAETDYSVVLKWKKKTREIKITLFQVHGEAGVKRIKMATAHETIKTMLAHMTNPKSSTHLSLKHGGKYYLCENQFYV